MKRFDKSVRINGDKVDFIFYRINTVNGPGLLVGAYKGDKHSVFNMQMNEQDRWEVVGDLPAWATSLKKELDKIINRF